MHTPHKGPLALALLTLGFAALSHAGTIQTPADSGGHLISANGPLGQTFTAQDPYVIIGLHIRPSDVFNDPNHTLLVQLLAGAGAGGTVLDSRTITPADGFVGYADIDYSSVAQLTVGNTYTVLMSTSHAYWVSDSQSISDPDYTGGVAVIQNALQPSLPDKSFHVIPVPEPAMTASAAAVALCIVRRRRS
jgi:hypothetical protein